MGGAEPKDGKLSAVVKALVTQIWIQDGCLTGAETDDLRLGLHMTGLSRELAQQLYP